MAENNGTFTYTYSAKQEDEVKRIQQKYMPHEETKIEQLRRLDKSAGKSGMTASITLGSISSLLLGTGMACIMEWQDLFIIGLAIGVVGMIGMLLAYPLYKSISKKARSKIAPEIIRLSNELRQEGK